VRRAGDDYQDAVALDLLVSMLEHPDRYEWIRVEADDFGYLDDVVALRRDGTIEAKQVKFSAHPENADDPYDWDDLTATKKGKNGQELPSLVGKWAVEGSYFDIIHDPSILDLKGGPGVGTSRHYTVARRVAHSLQVRQLSRVAAAMSSG